MATIRKARKMVTRGGRKSKAPRAGGDSRSRRLGQRTEAVRDLRRGRSYAAVRALVDALHDRHPEPRLAAAEALASRPLPLARAALCEALLRDPEELVRVAAAESLGVCGTECSLDALEWAMCKDVHVLVRSFASEAIAAIGGKRAKAAILRSLDSEKDDRVRVSMHAALKALGSKRELRPLGMLLDSPDYWARCASASALTDLAEDEEKPTVVRLLQNRLAAETLRSVRSRLVKCLQDLGVSAK